MTRGFGYIAILSLCLLGQITPAAAQNFAGCGPYERNAAEIALRQAKQLTLKAATAVGDTPQFERWFGDYAPVRAEVVRGNLKAVISAIRDGGVTIQCETDRADGCNQSEYAWVYPGQAYKLHLCPMFFDLPPLTALDPGSRHSDNGTREGTIVHELSHFTRVADTEDHCYSRSECSRMAQHDPRRVIENADSYQYYTEDVTYYARQPVSGKPPPASTRRH